MQLSKPWCSDYCVHFNTFEEHREHSKSEQHVFKIQVRYSGPSIPRYVMEKAMENWDRVKELWNEPPEERTGDGLEFYLVEAPEFHEELCLFCRHTSSIFHENMAHMKICHSFTIRTLKSHGVQPITVCPTLPTPTEVPGREVIGDDHHMNEERQQECSIFGNRYTELSAKRSKRESLAGTL
ncbi:hypothetical protein FGADI_48 [Fusarium gaditjirri]|uniref:Uncharacterized protein n=1 Tax=Fusarium gaditjirri TaxID=282569 RepID=A0A8H4X524_9HYPO|nr:hypothetical protein FGADI_48 [Fusarium gaditjirri]